MKKADRRETPTGPKHYAKAEELVELGRRLRMKDEFAESALLFAEAQVHATLAQVAAVATFTGVTGLQVATDDLNGWDGVL